jgi:protein dithiol oxidoreductase (disulfide-forming)
MARSSVGYGLLLRSSSPTASKGRTMIKRRNFSLTVGGAAVLALGGGSRAWAQGGPIEGRQYVRLSEPVPVSLTDPAKKVEVLEFFWYGCPACNAFAPAIEAWHKRLPADVAFRRVPVGFSVPHQLHQKMFFALERMGKVDELHSRIFAAIHRQNQRLMNERDIVEWVAANGVDAQEFRGLFRSMPVDSRSRQARQLHDAYRIEGVPSIGVHGRFVTSPSMAGGFDRALPVTEFLIQRARQAA